MSWKQYALIGLALVVMLFAGAVVLLTSQVQHFYVEKGVAGSYLAARQAAKNNDPLAAGDYYRQVLLANPQDMTILQATMQAQLLAGTIGQAQVSAARVLEVLPNNRQALLLQAITDFEAGDFSRAGRALNEMPRGPMSQLLEPNIRLWIAIAQGDTTSQKQALGQLARASSFAAVSLSQAAHALEMSGQIEAAAAHYNRAAQAGGLRFLFFTKSFGAFLERQDKSEEATKIYQFYQATHFFDPHIEAALERVKNGQKPIIETDEVVNLSLAFLAIGEVMMAEQRLELAAAYTQLAFYLDPGNDQTSFQLGQLAAAQQHWRAAEHHYGNITHDDIMFREAQVERAQILDELGATETAIALLTGQVEMYPDHQASLIALGDLYRAHRRFAESEKAYDQAINNLAVETKDDWHLYFARGIARERMGNWRQAEMDLQKARRLSNDEPHVLNYLGYSWVDKGIYLDEGLKIIEQAVAKKPQNGSFVDSLGWAYFKLGKYEKALEILQRAGQLEPTDPVVTDHLGDVLWRLGREFEARYQWRKALAFEPEEVDRKAIEEKLLLGLGPVPKAKPEAFMPRGGTSI